METASSQEDMQIKAIDHVSLYVSSIQNVKDFYRDLFQLTCKEIKTKSSPVLSLENDSLHFFINEDPHIDPEFVAKQHISFEVDSLEPVIQQLKSLNIPHKIGQYEGFETRNYRWCAWRDPENIRLECVEHF